MIFREAIIADIPQIQIVRNAVKENTLSDPTLVTDKDCKEFITVKGKGWVCEVNSSIVGFAIVDLNGHNIWALFIHPNFEGKGIAKKLHRIMMGWYFSQTDITAWLGTTPHTRAQQFYKLQGWTDVGMLNTEEVKFEMRKQDWDTINCIF